MRYLLFLLLVGCATVFDTDAEAIRQLEVQAYANRQYDRPNREIRYKFVENPDAVCRGEGVVAYATSEVKACAILVGDPCIVILPYAPLKIWVVEEQLHCRYGNWHKST